MVAFLNTDGGTIYIGLEDDGTVYGIEEEADEVSRKVVSTFRDSVTPDATGYFEILTEKKDNKNIIKIIVEPGTSIPYCLSKYGLVPQGVYVSSGSNTVTATREHIRQLIRAQEGHFLSELSIVQELTFEYAAKIFEEKDVEFKDRQKKTLGLIRVDGRYSNLALILSDQCPYSTKVAIFEGKTKEIFKDRKEFTGSLFKQIDEVLTYLNVYNRIQSTFEGAYRLDYSDYPEIALREAFINSLIHRDYYIEGSTLVSMFEDRLEIMSIGGLMPGVTRELMLSGVSVTRNEKLAQILYRLKLIEAYGTGIPRIISSYGNSKIKPTMPILDGGFLLSLPNRNFTDTFSFPVGSNEQKLFSIFQNQEFTKSEAAVVLRLSESGAYKFLNKLAEEEILTIRKNGKHFVYQFQKK
jgi:ATP-dependent DNA helicase RecG